MRVQTLQRAKNNSTNFNFNLPSKKTLILPRQFFWSFWRGKKAFTCVNKGCRMLLVVKCRICVIQKKIVEFVQVWLFKCFLLMMPRAGQ